MVEGKPLVSIGMPVYNEERWIRHTLDALLAQTFTDFELIVSDNASTDGTWEILQEYAAKDSRIVLYRQPETYNAIANFQFVLDQAHGEYFMWAGGHDLWSRNLLETLSSGLQANPRAVLCVPQAIQIDGENVPRPIMGSDQVIDTQAATSAAGRVLILERQPKPSNAFYGLYRRRVLLQTLPWPRVVGSDLIILIRIAALGDIITDQSVQWFRKVIRQETYQERVDRYVVVFGAVGLAARFPILAHRTAMMVEFLKAKGSIRERIALFVYGARRLFLLPGYIPELFQEFLAGVSALVRGVSGKFSTDNNKQT